MSVRRLSLICRGIVHRSSSFPSHSSEWIDLNKSTILISNSFKFYSQYSPPVRIVVTWLPAVTP